MSSNGNKNASKKFKFGKKLPKGTKIHSVDGLKLEIIFEERCESETTGDTDECKKLIQVNEMVNNGDFKDKPEQTQKV